MKSGTVNRVLSIVIVKAKPHKREKLDEYLENRFSI